MSRVLENVSWGDFPSWVTAVATVLALIAAGYAAWRTGKIVNIELGRDRERERREEREQASQVAAWAAESVHDPVGSTNVFSQFTTMSISGYVMNGSSQPVFNVLVLWFVNDEQIHRTALAVLPPGGAEAWEMPDEVMECFDDQTAEQGSKPLRGYLEAQLLSSMASEMLRLEVTFDDSHGRRWVRDRFGNLRKGDSSTASSSNQ
jgi:hypothetical protein